MYISLYVRLTILCIALAMLPLSFVGVLLGVRNYDVEERHVIEAEREITQGAALQVTSFITDLVDQLAISIIVSDIRATDTRTRELLLTQIIHTTNAFDELSWLDSTGRETVRVGRDRVLGPADLRDRSQEQEFMKMLATRQTYYGGVRFNDISHEPLITIILPAIDLRTQQINGALSADLRLKQVWDIVAAIPLGKEGAIAITDAQGLVIAHRDPSVVLRDTTLQHLERQGEVDGIRENVVRVATPFQIGDKAYYTVAEMPVDEAYRASNQSALTTAAIVFLTFIIATAMGILAVRHIVGPIRNLAATARAISAGDLSRDARVGSRDEIGDLAKAFNTMTAQLRGLLADLERRVAERTDDLKQALSIVQTHAAEQERLLAENKLQREMILGLSVPILPISRETLVMPLVGELDSLRLQMIQEQALMAINQSPARHLILDITGVPIVDSQVAQGLVGVVQAAKLLGTQVVLVGIRPEVAHSIVSLGLDLQGMRTSSDLQGALDMITAPQGPRRTKF